MTQRGWRRNLGNAFISLAAILLLGVGGAWGWERWQGRLLQNHLRAEQAAASRTPAAEPPATAWPTETQVPTAFPSALPTEVPVPTATETPTPPPGTKPVRLEIPDLKIDVPISEMTWTVSDTSNGPVAQWQVPENAAGHAVSSALPGEQGNVVLSGHNNIYGRVFMPISQAWPQDNLQKIDAYTDRSDILDGRQISITGEDGRQFDYVVTAFFRVKDSGVSQEQRQANAKYMDPTEQAQLTLITCWPPWSNTHRLILIAKPAAQAAGQ